MRSAMVVAAMLMMAAAGGAQTPAAELKVGDQAPRLQPAGERRQDLQALGLQGQAGRRAGVVPEGVYPGLHDRVQVARGTRRHDQEVQREVLHGERGPDRGRAGQQGLRRGAQRRLPTPERSRQENSRSVWCAQPQGMANRWTFYIGKDGKVLAIEKLVKPPTSAEDMAAKLGELKVEPAKPSQH